MTAAQRFMESRKARALVIALVNCDLVFFTAIIGKADPAVASSLITATLAIAGIYIGGQSAVDTVAGLNKDAQ